jgi:hypothetical protein
MLHDPVRLEPDSTSVDGKPRYDASARAIYVHVGPRTDREIATTLVANGVNFDCNRRGAVVGIEILLNIEPKITEASLPPSPLQLDWYDLYLSSDPQVASRQTFDKGRCILQIGERVNGEKTTRLSSCVVAHTHGDNIALSLTGVALASRNAGLDDES